MQNHLNKGHYVSYQRPATANKRLQEALANRERYLERHPHLRVYQTEIDRVLDKSGNVQGRLAVIGMLIQGKLLEMQEEFSKLNKFLQ
ncbi:MAG: hypothetical protein KQI81_00355 [Deltaproteobacteria bacterium]|nr:hypothetical protein [Deltaproteobacteria bacterium]